MEPVEEASFLQLPLEQENLLTDHETSPILEERSGPWTLKAWKLLSGALLLAGLAGIVADRPARGFLLRPFKGQELWIPTGWHKDSEGHDVKDTWDHYKMPDCDSGPAPGTKKKVILTPEQLKKMQAKKEKEERVLEDEFWTTERLLPYGRRLRGVEERFLVDELADDHQDGKNPLVRWVTVKRTRAQEICAEHKAIARGDHQRMIQQHEAFLHRRDEIRDLHYWQGTHRCGIQYANTDFDSKDTWQDLGGAESPAHCQRQCTWNRGCEGFSWSRWGCYLKRLEEHPKHNRSKDSSFTHKHVEEVYSGYPCDRKESPYPWINDELQKHSLPLPEVLHGRPPHVPNASMFCTMLILPYTYEVQLTIMQHRSYYSIFLCDSWKVYSSQRLHLAPGLETHLVNTSQVAEMAGQWGTALNTEAFLAYWRALIQDGDYLKANWLVKVDPDTVWFPDRLVPILRQQEHSVHSMEEPGIYLNNCGQGLHGPIEVLSRSAFSTFAKASSQCFWAMNNWGNWQWGEDMWLDQCLLTVAHTKRIYVGQMLAEDHCNKWPGWDQCNSQEIVAYHPYKSADSYIACTATGLTTTATTSRTLTWTTTGTTVTVTQTTTTVSNMNPVQQLENMLGSLFRH